MIGLITYPALIEPRLTNHLQAWTWSISYGAFALVCAAVTWRVRGTQRAKVAQTGTPRPAEYLLWAGLAACASALLLAGTAHPTQNIAAIPFLWVLPLSLHLLSFILSFDNDRWYRRGAYDPETNLTFWGTGNPNPGWNGDPRALGDNLYSDSVVALDADTGKLNGITSSRLPTSMTGIQPDSRAGEH